ncbi:MAG: succinylglutamate desuccinylase/aspartoacylase family protein [Hyphomicrobiaceae bacterium]|nr:succinylglutamate desuccinylase/aspartoacylase family protein [Hyphomicrobiaceae bacterium]
MDNSAEDLLIARPRLHVFDHFPSTLLDVPAGDLWRVLEGPTLFRIEGRQSQPLFLSVLLHGNEDTGWQAVQSVMREAAARGLPRTLLLFVGNIDAARANVRTLPTQNDYNRTWPGTLLEQTDEAAVMREVVEMVRASNPFASIDIHNNTGNNPHYACLNELTDPYLHLARLFSRTIVYFKKPLGVQSAAMARICPAVTVECGRVGGTAGVDHAAEFIHAALAMSHFPHASLPEGDVDLLQTRAIVKVSPEATFSFDGGQADFRFRADLDHLNFSELKAGTSFGALGGTGTHRLDVVPCGEFTLRGEYFDYQGGEIRLARPAIPSMLTLDPNAVRLDCLGYLMQRIARDGTVLTP